MKTNYEIRYAAHPEDAKSYDTTRIRRDFLIEKIFVPNEVNMVYSMYDRMVVGGALPVGEVLTLEAIDPLKAPFFLTRREMGIYNVGGPGIVKAGDAEFELDYKEALYLGSGDRVVTFESKDAAHPAKFYFNSLTAHRNYPDRKVTKADAVVAEMGSLEGSNHRNINKMLVNQVLPTCQLQMGMTELAPGSVWNTIGKLPDKDREEGITNGDFQKFKEGHSIYEFWLYQYAGVDQMTGRSVYLPDFNAYYIAGEDGKTPVNGEESTEGKNPIPTDSWVDINGQYYTGDPRYARKDWSGSSLPKINGSVTTSLRWKDLTLSALMIFSCGSKVFDQPYQTLTSVGVHSLTPDLLNAWTAIPEGMTPTSPNRLDPSGIPQVNLDATINGYNSQKASTRYIVSGDYLSIKNITLSYRLPATWSKRLTLGGIRLHAAIENVALFSKRKGLNPVQTFDGIVNNYTSIARVFSFGVNINL
jgi:5-keto 4-deoxyuronate isomerase